MTHLQTPDCGTLAAWGLPEVLSKLCLPTHPRGKEGGRSQAHHWCSWEHEHMVHLYVCLWSSMNSTSVCRMITLAKRGSVIWYLLLRPRLLIWIK